MERYLFFNSSQNDVRQYQAGDFAWYFGNVLKSGLIHTDGVPELQVKCQGTDLRTYVEVGKAIIQGHAYENTSNLYLEHALPEATMDRIDRIVLRLDKRNQSRFIKLFVLQGDPGSNPVAPALQRDEFIHELSLAQIRVRANTSALNPADLIDERLDESLCGLVSIQNTGFARVGDFQNHVENFENHVNNKNNPHGVTTSQIGAIPTSEKGATNGVATLNSSGALVQKPYVTGKYTGDGAESRTINLGFRPSAVLLVRENGETKDDYGVSGGLALDGSPVKGGLGGGVIRNSFEIASSGFIVYYGSNYSSTTYYQYANYEGYVYHYIAFR